MEIASEPLISSDEVGNDDDWDSDSEEHSEDPNYKGTENILKPMKSLKV